MIKVDFAKIAILLILLAFAGSLLVSISLPVLGFMSVSNIYAGNGGELSPGIKEVKVRSQAGMHSTQPVF